MLDDVNVDVNVNVDFNVNVNVNELIAYVRLIVLPSNNISRHCVR